MGRLTYLTPDVHAKLVAAARSGAYLKDCAAYAGIGERLLYEWMARGRRYEEHLDGGGEIIEGEDIYRMMTTEVEQGRAGARIEASMEIRKAWRAGDWRAAMTYLERTDPQNWARVQRVEMSGRDGGPMEFAEVTDTERRLVASLRPRLEAAKAAGELVAGETAEDAEVIEHEMVTEDDYDQYPEVYPGEHFMDEDLGY